MSDLEGAIAELEAAAARLRADDLDPQEAADLVERCAQLAAEVGAALDRRDAADAREGQERLL